MILPKNPIISLNDGSDRLTFKNSLLERVNDAAILEELDDNLSKLTPEELAVRNNLILKKVSKTGVKFNEKLHPRNSSGLFAKKPEAKKSSGKIFAPIGPYVEANRGADVHDKAQILGSDGFKNILGGLALGAINDIIAIPKELPKVRVIESKEPLDGGTQGFYSPSVDIITIGKTTTIGSSTLIHELGHYLDQHMTGSNGKKLSDDDGILAALKNSPEYKQISKVHDTTRDAETKGFTSYLMQPNEMFARAFAQWISTKSNNKTLKSEVAGVRDAYGPLQWEDKAFEPISKAFDNLFKSKGLLRKR